MNPQEELLERGVANIIPNKNVLLGKLRAGKKLNIYFGIDPTSTKIHLGHAVPLRKLQKFAKDNHTGGRYCCDSDRGSDSPDGAAGGAGKPIRRTRSSKPR
ncbi:MAG: hypothetical protein EPN53_15120 [Acidobacteria bacterium]|nr:MAG: hypothetical protein EPN53_15120 [Acidobacteriota bacterium]